MKKRLLCYLFVLTCISHLVNSAIPEFIKTPQDIQVQAGSIAELECHATGPPTLVISWQKDGVSNFPAMQENRIHINPAQSVTFIADVKKVDEGIYSCWATNKDGSVTSNATLTVVAANFILWILEMPFLSAEIEMFVKYCKICEFPMLNSDGR